MEEKLQTHHNYQRHRRTTTTNHYQLHLKDDRMQPMRSITGDQMDATANHQRVPGPTLPTVQSLQSVIAPQVPMRHHMAQCRTHMIDPTHHRSVGRTQAKAKHSITTRNLLPSNRAKPTTPKPGRRVATTKTQGHQHQNQPAHRHDDNHTRSKTTPTNQRQRTVPR